MLIVSALLIIGKLKPLLHFHNNKQVHILIFKNHIVNIQAYNMPIIYHKLDTIFCNFIVDESKKVL